MKFITTSVVYRTTVVKHRRSCRFKYYNGSNEERRIAGTVCSKEGQLFPTKQRMRWAQMPRNPHFLLKLVLFICNILQYALISYADASLYLCNAILLATLRDLLTNTIWIFTLKKKFSVNIELDYSYILLFFVHCQILHCKCLLSNTYHAFNN